jgi:hypothetical protein
MKLFENSIFFPSTPSVSLTEILVVFAVACIAYFLAFNNFEKHGINGLTAEPHDKYLEVIAKMKGNKQT